VLASRRDPGQRRSAPARPSCPIHRSQGRHRRPRCQRPDRLPPVPANLSRGGGGQEGGRLAPLSGVSREGQRPSGNRWPGRGVSGARVEVGPESATTSVSTTQLPRLSLPTTTSPTSVPTTGPTPPAAPGNLSRGGGGREGGRPAPLSGVSREGQRPSGNRWPGRGVSGARVEVGPGSARSSVSTTQLPRPSLPTTSSPTSVQTTSPTSLS